MVVRHSILNFDIPVPASAESSIRQLIAGSPEGWLSFAEVMHLALFHPGHGYYSGSPRRIGRAGDFFTAVSVGPLYGRLLAAVAEETWESLGRPGEFTLIEQGAHDGQLAADVWAGLQEGPLGGLARYLIVEPKAGYRRAQKDRLLPLMDGRVDWADDPALLPALPGGAFFLCNELLDAFPVHRLRWTGTAWEEVGVVIAAGELAFEARPITAGPLADEAARLPKDLPSGYTTEVHPAATEWMRRLAAVPFRGAVLIADYGYEEAEYRMPERADGTLRRYREHQVDGEVLKDLGESDLTAHINFTPVITEAAGGGFQVKRFMEQGRFLTHAAKPWLASLEGRPPSAGTMALLRQFQTLTHPGHMGAAFRMLLLERD